MNKLLAKLSLAVVAALSLGASIDAARAEPVKNIVLVHGAFADGSSWAKVIPFLQAKGYNVTAVQNPLTSLADDVASTKRALAIQTGPTILVGHSWGGAVITEAGVDEKVVGLVYVAAFGPDVGESLNPMIKKYPPPPAFAHPSVDKEGFVSLPVDSYVEHFMQDVPAEEAKVNQATQGPISAAAFEVVFTNAAWKTRPSWYIVAKQDGAIAPDMERFYAQRMKATTSELDSGHVPMLSQPENVAKVIIEAAEAASK